MAASPAPEACLPSCTIPGTTFAYVPPATVVASGATVSWTALDTAHTATAADFCFHVIYGDRPGEATFRIADGGVTVATPTRAARPCPEATALPDGSFLLEYVCLYHPLMRGALNVVPGLQE